MEVSMSDKPSTVNIHTAMINAMGDVEAIAKSKRNQSQNFNFRGIDDVYNSMHAILAKHRIYTMPEVLEDRHEERTTKSGSSLIYRILKIRYTFITDDGSSMTATVIGEGMDSGDKASNKAMSVAHKYCLLQAFCIPTEDMPDPDAETPEPSKPAKSEAKPSKPEPTVDMGTLADDMKAALAALAKVEDAPVIEGYRADGKIAWQAGDTDRVRQIIDAVKKAANEKTEEVIF